MIRDDVPTEVAEELERLVFAEPPLYRLKSDLSLRSPSLAALGLDPHRVDDLFGFLWVFPTAHRGDGAVELVSSGTKEAHRLLDRFTEAIPESLAARGFRQPTDLWEPWCVAIIENRIVSIAQTVRTGPGGAELGVDTALDFRGHGLAAVTSAELSRHPALDGLTLFYSTGRANASSRRVVDRLGLRLVALTFAIP